MKIYARSNHIGWIHLWRTRAAQEAGEASEHFFNPAIDPRWQELALGEEERQVLAAGGLVELEDPGYLDEEDGA